MLANLADGQRPFAVILGCSDSRVPPELAFDAGYGNLFIIRVAGNVVPPRVVGSLQYACTHLRRQLAMVLGYERCGAVQPRSRRIFGLRRRAARAGADGRFAKSRVGGCDCSRNDLGACDSRQHVPSSSGVVLATLKEHSK